jgi:TFIIF-interacting CTD phosphatase-like protein
MEFLQAMSKLYEIVIFTAGMQEYADWVLNQLDKDHKLIKHRLYRQHTINTAKGTGPLIIKDLSKLGRPLERTIIVDNLAENFIL